MIRLLIDRDHNDYCELINQLSEVGDISKEDFEKFVILQHLLPSIYNIFVFELDNKCVGCVSTFIENKVSRKCLHIEDVVTHKDYRGRNIASQLLTFVNNFAKKNNCYKIILDCQQHNVGFYEKLGFKLAGNQMSIKF